MSEKEIENSVEEEDFEDAPELDEGKKASFGDPSEIPDPVAKKAKAPGKSKSQGDSSSPAQGSSEKPKTKMALLNAMMQHAGSMRKNDLQSAYDKMLGEDAELEEVVEQEEAGQTRIEKITTHDIDVADDIRAVFSGSDLSEEFKEKAIEIFETAVVAKVNEKLDEVAQIAETEINESTEVFNKELIDKIDNYLEYVVEQWLEDNTLAVEQGIRSEITESFIGGLRELFENHYIDVPEEKVDIVDELAGKVEELEGKLNEEIETGISMKKEREVHQRAFVFAEVSAGLSETQVAKMESLSEAIEYTDSDSYKEKLETVKESYFSGPKEVARSSFSSLSLDEDPIDDDGEEAIAPTGTMAAYVSNITNQVKQ